MTSVVFFSEYHSSYVNFANSIISYLDTDAAICAKSTVLDFSWTPGPLLPPIEPENDGFERNNGTGVQLRSAEWLFATNNVPGVRQQCGLPPMRLSSDKYQYLL